MRWLSFVVIVAGLLVLLLVGAGQAGLLSGSAPSQQSLGVRDGRLAAPSETPNSVSSQADLYPDHPQRAYARIAPLQFEGDGSAAMTRLAAVLRSMERTRIIAEKPDYIRAEIESRWLRFIDDAEFWLDPASGVIQLRSASRLGRRDMGTNRSNMEAIRARFGAGR